MAYDNVLVRAATGQPVAMIVVTIGKGLVYVANPSSIERIESGQSWPVGVPDEDVFEFDESVFARLLALWKRQMELPREEWRRFGLRLYSTSAGLPRSAS